MLFYHSWLVNRTFPVQKERSHPEEGHGPFLFSLKGEKTMRNQPIEAREAMIPLQALRGLLSAHLDLPEKHRHPKFLHYHEDVFRAVCDDLERKLSQPENGGELDQDYTSAAGVTLGDRPRTYGEFFGGCKEAAPRPALYPRQIPRIEPNSLKSTLFWPTLISDGPLFMHV